MQAKIILIIFIFLNCIQCFVYGLNFKNTMKITLPAYAVASESFILSNSSSCRKDLEIFAEAINNKTLWSLKMLDASGIPKPGFYYGNKFWLGVRSQCLSLHNSNVENSYPPFGVNYFAAYFLYDLETTKNKVLTLGLCLPNICTNNELSFILQKIFEKRNLMMSDIYEVNYKLLRVSDLKTNYNYLLNWKSIIIIIIIVFTILIMIIGTFFDIVLHRKGMKNLNISSISLTINNDSPKDSAMIKNDISNAVDKQKQNIFGEMIRCFSVYTNIKLLFHSKEGSDSIKCIHGLKCFATICVIVFHAKTFTDLSSDNTYLYTKGLKNVLVEAIDRTHMAVDIFFFSGGFLNVYTFHMRERKNKIEGKEPTKLTFYSIFNAIYKRYIRLTPAYMMTMGITYICFSHFDDVSQFFIPTNNKYKNVLYGGKENCDNYWWTHLLYINNLSSFNDMCTVWSWYLANDMQYFIIGYIITASSVIYFYSSAVVWLVLMISTTIISGYVSYSLNFFLTNTISIPVSTMDYLYKLPWNRIGPYLIGMAVANNLLQTKRQIGLNKVLLWIFWILPPAFIVAFIWSTTVEFSIHETAVVMSLGRLLLGLVVGWIVWASATGYGGIVNTFLSHEIFVVLGRLTYCAYLINPTIIFLLYFDADKAIHTDILFQLPTFLGIVVLTFFGALICYLMFETPYILLLRVLTTKSTRKLNNYNKHKSN